MTGTAGGARDAEEQSPPLQSHRRELSEPATVPQHQRPRPPQQGGECKRVACGRWGGTGFTVQCKSVDCVIILWRLYLYGQFE